MNPVGIKSDLLEIFMKPHAQNIALAVARGWTCNPGFATDKPWRNPKGEYLSNGPDYLNSLNDIRDAEEILNEEKYSKRFSSNPMDHADRRYQFFLREVVGVNMYEELVLSVGDEHRGQMNKRNGPYPAPIVLPRSAIVLSHWVPCAGEELKLIRATAAQRLEALLKTIGKWEDD